MVSTAILAGLMVLLLNTVDQTQRVWTRATAKAGQFQAARGAFESLTRRMSQATLNAYWRPFDVEIIKTKANIHYRRQSELQFLSGPTSQIFGAAKLTPAPSIQIDTSSYPTHSVFFHAPLGYTEELESPSSKTPRFRSLDNMLVACGYFIEYGPDPDQPAFINRLAAFPAKKRFRLMELTVPGERLKTFDRGENAVVPAKQRSSIAPRIIDMNKKLYVGLVDQFRNATGTWVPPFWMGDALKRESIDGSTGGTRFRYAHVRAENIIALVILPKLPPKDRTPPGTDKLALAPSYRYDSARILSGFPGKDADGVDVDNSARDNLLPPIVQVTMVAVDEVTMSRLPQGDDPIPFTKGLFEKAERESDYTEDIKRLEKDLTQKKLNYRIFSTDVVIRGSKWSRDPEAP